MMELIRLDLQALWPAFVLIPAASLAAALLILILRPVLARYALARPNARSAHAVPTPQGGGIAVVAAMVLAAGTGAAILSLDRAAALRLGIVGAGALLMGLVGWIDDIRPLPPLPRLALQLFCVALVVVALPDNARVLAAVPLPIERIILVVGGAWFVNLVNFMDGMDWMTVVETVPMTVALVLFWVAGFLSPPAGLLALGLCGGMLGFAPFNRPVARLFLGDVGSLPIGLVMAYCLFDLAAHGGLVAAILLALYYIADSGVTLIWRLRRGDRVWEAHRLHFYQVATARGYKVREVLARVAAVNVALAVFAAASLMQDSPVLLLIDAALGAALVARLLHELMLGRPANLNAPP